MLPPFSIYLMAIVFRFLPWALPGANIRCILDVRGAFSTWRVGKAHIQTEKDLSEFSRRCAILEHKTPCCFRLSARVGTFTEYAW